MEDTFLDRLGGFELVEQEYLTETRFMLYPQYTHPWVTYEEKDHGWLVGLGMGSYQQIPNPNIYLMGNQLIGHPDTLHKLKLELMRGKQ